MSNNNSQTVNIGQALFFISNYILELLKQNFNPNCQHTISLRQKRKKR